MVAVLSKILFGVGGRGRVRRSRNTISFLPVTSPNQEALGLATATVNRKMKGANNLNTAKKRA